MIWTIPLGALLSPEFQFLYGTIMIASEAAAKFEVNKFQFLYGTIMIYRCNAAGYVTGKFQFLYGTIMISVYQESEMEHIHFNSSMVRL